MLRCLIALCSALTSSPKLIARRSTKLATMRTYGRTRELTSMRWSIPNASNDNSGLADSGSSANPFLGSELSTDPPHATSRLCESHCDAHERESGVGWRWAETLGGRLRCPLRFFLFRLP